MSTRVDADSVRDAALVAASSSKSGEDQLPLDVLTAALWLSLWVAFGSFSLAVADGLGPHPTRRLLIGLLLVFVSAAALCQRQTVCAWLRARPWLVVPFAAAQLSAAAVDGLLRGPYVALSITSIGLAVIVTRPRTVWLCVALLDLSYASVVLIDQSPAALVRSGQLAGVLGALLGYPFAALIGLGVVRLFARFLGDVESNLDAMRRGAPALTPALTRAIERGGRSPLALLPAPSLLADLTPAELRVVEGLASGSAPKELAHRWGVSLATVRTHVMHAKRKTGARTLRELATMVVHFDGRDTGDRGA